jgi:hypothetical protein
MGVSAGAIDNGKTVYSGTTFTDFIKMLLIQEMDYTPVLPKLEWSNSATIPSGTIEVGTNVSFAFASTKTNGSFTGATANGFNPSVSGAGDTFGTVTYSVYSGSSSSSSLITATTETGYTINSVPEGNYTVKASVPYTGVTAASLGLKKNTGKAASEASFPNGTASAEPMTFNVRYKAYYGTTTATGNTTSHNFVFSGNGNNVVTSNSEWLNTKGEKMIKETTWSNEGKNMFVLTNGTLSYIESAKMPDTNLKGNFELIDSNYQVSIGGTQTANYKLYLYTVDGGTTVEYRKLKITR